MNCNKVSFSSKQDAVKRIAEIKEEDGDNKKPIRSYKCEKCGSFHLTSWSKKRKKIVEKRKVIREINKLEFEADYWINKKRWN